MGQVIVRNLNDHVIASLKAKATAHGHSLEQELREILARESGLDRLEKAALADRIRAMTPGELTTDSTDLIRQDRDRR